MLESESPKAYLSTVQSKGLRGVANIHQAARCHISTIHRRENFQIDICRNAGGLVKELNSHVSKRHEL
jgi:transcriptional regulator